LCETFFSLPLRMLRTVLFSVVLVCCAAGEFSVEDNSPSQHVIDFLRTNSLRFGLSLDDLNDIEVSDIYMTKHNHVFHVYLRQKFDNREVINTLFHTNVMENGEIFGGNVPPSMSFKFGRKSSSSSPPFFSPPSSPSSFDFFVKNITNKKTAHDPQITPSAAIISAIKQLKLSAPDADIPNVDEHFKFVVKEVKKAKNGDTVIVFDGAGISFRDLLPKLVYYHVKDTGEMRLAWHFDIYFEGNSNIWEDFVIDATTGATLERKSWVDHETEQVYEMPKESPNDGDREIETNPADPKASPFGWHNDGTEEYTITKGNNVAAQEDHDRNNRDGYSPDGGDSLNFEFPLDLTQTPTDYVDAAITNLFYWNNIMHDALYAYGFDESAGNFQTSNFDNGGAGGDAVDADAQDGSGSNNANFATPPDGSKPRMQMYQWTDPANRQVLVEDFWSDYGKASNFGPFNEVPTAQLAIGEDGEDKNYGCNPLINFPSGAIALVNEGTCDFVTKVANAQAAGAVAVLVVSETSDRLITMTGSGSDITIPSVYIGQLQGRALEDAIKAARPNFLTGKIVESVRRPNRDSDLDSGIIAHEYCHGLSRRLTGGPTNTGCLNTLQQAGEGWSDLCSLFFTAKDTETATDFRGIGSYVLFLNDQSHGGLRPAPYTTDMNKNPYTYINISDVSRPHGVGFVWASAVWEVYWNLVSEYGFNSDLYYGNGGNNVAIQLVIDGLKMQPCSPSFLEARDAILEADHSNTGGVNSCPIWRGFAKRGMGVSATTEGSNTLTEITEGYDVPPGCE